MGLATSLIRSTTLAQYHFAVSALWLIVEPRLTDSPEMWPSTIMQTLCLVWIAISIDLHTIRTPEMQIP